MPTAPTTSLTLPIPTHFQLATAGLFVSRGSGTHPRRTIDTWELIFVRSGTLHIREAQRQFAVGTQETLLLHPGRLHDGTEPYSEDLSFFWLHFRQPTVQPEDGHRARSPQAAPLTTLTLQQHSRPARPDRLIELFHHLLDDVANGHDTPLTHHALLLLIFHEVAQELSRDGSAQRPVHALASQAERYIAQFAHQPISTATIADRLGCNPDYLGQLFRASFGQTITQAILHARLQDAHKLLRESSLNINQVAEACGFQTPGYFRRLFLASEGMTPSRYRRLHQRMYINVR